MAQVFLSTAKRRELKAHFGVSEQCLSESLHFKRKSALGRSIRAYAVNHLKAFVIL